MLTILGTVIVPIEDYPWLEQHRRAGPRKWRATCHRPHRGLPLARTYITKAFSWVKTVIVPIEDYPWLERSVTIWEFEVRLRHRPHRGLPLARTRVKQSEISRSNPVIVPIEDYPWLEH